MKFNKMLLSVGFGLLGAMTGLAEQPSTTAAAPVRFDRDTHVADLTQAAWEFHVADRDAKIDTAAVAAVNDWKPILVGKRWEHLGHPELNSKTVWLKLPFQVSADPQSWRIGFFCTAVDDTADFYLNGQKVGSTRYSWGSVILKPTAIDLTPQIRPGENLLIIRVIDSNPARKGGIVGNVCLYKTLPFARTDRGGIAPAGQNPEELSVVLHLGQALLTKGDRIRFSPAELRELEIPPYILREDELILTVPASLVSAPERLHRVQLDNVSPVTDRRPLAVRADSVPQTVGRYERMEIPLAVAATYDNPFDPQQIDVAAVVKTPSNRIERVPAFFCQDFTPVEVGPDEEILLPQKGNPWKLYYRPRETGVHEIEIIAQDTTGIRRAAPQKLTVTESSLRGFLRVSKRDPRYFEFDNGESFFGIGPSGWFRDENYFFGGNTRWLTTRRQDGFYERKAANHSTFDYCLATFFGQMYTRGGFIDQHVFWRTEHRVRTLERLGIHWIVVYDDVLRQSAIAFDDLPYSAAQGGPCRAIHEVYFNPRALRMQKDQLQYFVGRLSDSPAIWIWNCGDEGQPGNAFSPGLVRWWLQELHAHIRAIDVYQHPHVIGEYDLAQGSDAVIIGDWYTHEKPRGGGKGAFACDQYFADDVSLTACLLARYADLKCPVIIPEGGPAEYSQNHYIGGQHWDFPEAISYHQNLWASLFLKSAAGGTDWLVNVIDRTGQLFHAAAMHKYLEGESLTQTSWTITAPEVSDEKLRAFALQSDQKSLVWVQNRGYTWYDVGHRKQPYPTIREAHVTVPVIKEGPYRIEFWDTRTGRVTSTVTLPSSGKTIRCPLPPVDKDVALKLIHLSDTPASPTP